MSTLTAGRVAPLFELTNTSGARCSLQDALARGPVLAVFFKVSCPTCQYAFPFIERLYQQFRETGLQACGISQDNARDTELFAEDCGVTFPLLIDDKPYKVSRQYGVQYTPTHFLIAPAGEVQLTGDGFSKRDLLEAQKWLARRSSTAPAALFLPKERVPEYKPG